MYKVYVEDQDLLTIRMFEEWDYEIVHDHTKADLIVFTGGADVSPELYAEVRQPECGAPRTARDLKCVGLYNYAYANDIPVAGICRGAQFITVMQGGKLIQHIEGHAGPAHMIYFQGDWSNNHEDFIVNSVHHQAMIPASDVFVMATAEDNVVEVTCFDRFYVGYYKQLYTDFCVQAHPEYLGTDDYFQIWYMNCIKRLLNGWSYGE